MLARRAQSDWDIIRDAALDKVKRVRDFAVSVYRWFDDVAWDELVCRAIGHKRTLKEYKVRSTYSKSWVYEIRCERCERAIGTSAATYVAAHDPHEVARRSQARRVGWR